MGGFITLALFSLYKIKLNTSMVYLLKEFGFMRILRSRPVMLGIGLIIINGIFFGLTNPNDVASILLIAGFALVMLDAYFVIRLALAGLSLYLPWFSRQKHLSMGILVCLGVLLALQSVGQLSSRDVVLVPLATLVLYAYSRYNQSPKTAKSH